MLGLAQVAVGHENMGEDTGPLRSFALVLLRRLLFRSLGGGKHHLAEPQSAMRTHVRRRREYDRAFDGTYARVGQHDFIRHPLHSHN